MAVNKVVFGGETLIDLTGDTVAPEVLLAGYTATNAAGEAIAGAAVIPTKTSELENDSGFLTEQDISGKLDKTGDGSNVTAAFTTASSRTNISTGEKLSVLFGKIAKWFSDLGSLAFKSTVSKSDLESSVQTSLSKADTALQSYTESDPVFTASAASGITSTDISEWDTAYTHSQSAHAPSNAQENVIESIKVNGAAQTVTDKAVDITVPKQQVWYGTCRDSTSTKARIVTTTTGDFKLENGNIVSVYFTNPASQIGCSLNVDGTGSKTIYMSNAMMQSYVWEEKEVLTFVYDGQYFRPTSATHLASSSYYGLVKLSDSTSSTASNTASSVTAVKSAYDLANTANTAASTAQSAVDTHVADSTIHVTADEKSAWNAKAEASDLNSVIAESATLADGIVTLTLPSTVTVKDGLQIGFVTPSNSLNLTGGLSISGVIYNIVDGRQRSVCGQAGFFGKSSVLTVTLDVTNSRAFLQNIAMIHVGDSVVSNFGLATNATVNDAFDVVSSVLANKAPAYTYGTTDLTAGSSTLETGKLYFVYE